MSRLHLAVALASSLIAPAVVNAESVRDITFDTVKFEHVKGSPFDRAMLTDPINQLDGKLVRIRGYMYPTNQQSGLKQFVLVRDNQECCFGKGAALFDCMIVEMIGDATAEFSVVPIAVEGVFTIRELKGPGGRPLAIYHLDGRSVK
jgi:hypothetical protein